MNLILVTGGSGFLGINVVRFFLNKGYKIRVLDKLDFDYPEKDKIEFFKGDIRDEETVKRVMKRVNYVVHCAAALPLYKKEDIFSTDVDGTRLLLKYAHENNVERFIHISSTAVYGIPDHHPLYESDKLDGVGPYGEAKILAEKVCEEYREKGMFIPILRPKSFIGPERLGVFAIFYEWVKDGKNFPFIGSGQNRYQLLDVEDLCEAIYLCLTSNNPKVNDVFNIGAKDFTTMKEDYEAVFKYAKSNKKLIHFPVKPVVWTLRFLEFFKLSPLYKWVYETASEDSFVSIEKAEEILKYKPKFSNKQALIRNYKWYITHYDEFKNKTGINHRVPWKQGILKFLKIFF
ncbi:NAD(P)-dependent oxidoreductase [Candidatus Woesearchaeota archaeon]|nr:NAD(P)-dependent oxidoreductase [Candidatus Woesearchaeota archaeon]